MAKNKNCPNCGAPYELEVTKCPYCGTSYFDMASIDMATTEPFYLKIRYGEYLITQKVLPDFGEFNLSEDQVECYGHGVMLVRIPVSKTLTTRLSFVAVQGENDTLVTFEVPKR